MSDRDAALWYRAELINLIGSLKTIHRDEGWKGEHCLACGCLGECDKGSIAYFPCWPCETIKVVNEVEELVKGVRDGR